MMRNPPRSGALAVNEQFSLVHVGMEKSVPHRSAQKGLDDVAAKVLQIIAFAGERLDVGQGCSIDPFERQHLFRSPVPIDSRDPQIRILGNVLGKFRSRGRFQTEIPFPSDGAGERINDLDEL